MSIFVARWQSPFHDDLLGPFAPPAAAVADTGDVLLLRCSSSAHSDGATEDADSLPGHVQELRRRFPGSPVAVWIMELPPERVIDLVRAATSSSIRPILGGPAPDSARLRIELTQPEGLSTFVLRWASDVGYLPPDTVQNELRTLLDAAPTVRTLHRLATQRHEAERTWRNRLQQLGLPTPRAWLGLAHSLHVAFYLQRNHDQPLHLLAHHLGYSDLTLMSRRFQSVFRMAPGAVRGLLGAEPLLHRWFSGAARPIRKP